MIVQTQIFLFLVRLLLVWRLVAIGGVVACVVAGIGAVALVTTAFAWWNGKGDLTWRGSFVGLSYLVVCMMAPGPLTGALSILFGLVLAGELLARIVLGARCTITAPVFVSVVREFPYSLVRHPLTATEWAMAALFLVSAPTVPNWIAFGLVSLCNVVAIRFEEAFLSEQAAYRTYKQQTPWRVIPGAW